MENDKTSSSLTFMKKQGLEMNLDKKDSQHHTTNHLNMKETPIKPGIFTATSKPPPPIEGFKTFTEQVAGHLETHNTPCFMIDDHGHILKILEKGSKLIYMEQAFYERLFADDNEQDEWSDLKKFIPKFFGVVKLNHKGRNLCYLKLENLVSRFEHPCIMDLKIGKRTFDPFATPDKIHRELIRYDYQAQLGFRISGFKVYKAKIGQTELYDRFHCKKFKPDDMEKTLEYFFDLENFPERISLVAKLLDKLKCLMEWFKKQKRIKFYCTSLLIAYDGNNPIQESNKDKLSFCDKGLDSIISKSLHKNQMDSFGLFCHEENSVEMHHDDIYVTNKKQKLADLNSARDDDVVMSMIDFTHTFIDLENTIDEVDENYIFGLRSLMDLLKNVLLHQRKC